MSGIETNLKSTRARPGHYETEIETETLKISLRTFITVFYQVVYTLVDGSLHWLHVPTLARDYKTT